MYQIDKRTGAIEYIEQSVLLVPELKLLVNYYKRVNFARMGWFYLDIIVLISSSRSPYNQPGWTEDEKLERALNAAYVRLCTDIAAAGNSSKKPEKPEISQFRLKVFTDALQKFRELDYDLVFEEYMVVGKQYKAVLDRMNNLELSSKSTNNESENSQKELASLVKLLEEMRKQYENCKKILFDNNKSKDNKVLRKAPPISNAFENI